MSKISKPRQTHLAQAAGKVPGPGLVQSGATNAYTARAIFRSDMVGQVRGFLLCLVCVTGANLEI